MPDIAFAGSARLLVVLHAAAAIVLIGSTTHHAIIAINYARGRAQARLGRIYAVTLAITYVVTFAIGLFAYPTFRYHVRALYLDRYETWAANLFDTKENFAALGLPIVLAIALLSRVMDPKEDRALVTGYLALSLLAAAIVWFSVFSGFAITLAKGV